MIYLKTPAMKIVDFTILGMLLVFIILFLYSCCVISSRISRDEEQFNDSFLNSYDDNC